MEPIQLLSQRASTNEIKSNQASSSWKVLFASLSQSSVVPNLNDLGALPLFLPKCTSENTLVELKLSSNASSQPFFCPLGNADSQKLKLMTGKNLFWEMSWRKGNKKSWKYPVTTIPKWSFPPNLEIQYRRKEKKEKRWSTSKELKLFIWTEPNWLLIVSL